MIVPKRSAPGLAARPSREIETMRPTRSIPTIASLILLVAACGGTGGGVAASVPADATAVAGQTQPDAAGQSLAAGEAAPSDAPATAAPAAASPAGGGGSAASVCALVTEEELAGIFGVPSVTMTVIPGPPDNCIVDSESGDPLTAWSLTTAQAQAVYGAFATDPSTIEVSGLGDKAAIVQNTGLLVLKGSNLLVISISGGADMSEDEVTEASKQIGAIAAGRL